MKMRSLIFQELRQSLWIQSALVFLFFLSLDLHINKLGPFARELLADWDARYYLQVFHKSPLAGFPQIMLIACIAFGLSVAWVQYGRPSRRNEWAFFLHRPVRRWQWVVAKLIGAGLPILVLPLLVWLSKWKTVMEMPVWEFGSYQLWEGVLIPFWGYAAYLALALVFMEKEEWIVRRSLPPLFLLVAFGILYGGEEWTVAGGAVTCCVLIAAYALRLFYCINRRAF
jgi:hypothetical protein